MKYKCDLCDSEVVEGSGQITSDTILCQDCCNKLVRVVKSLQYSELEELRIINNRIVNIGGYEFVYKE